MGLHTGVDCRIVVEPASPGAGRVFICDNVEIAAHANNVVDTSRSTSIGCADRSVRTVEHLMAALSGCLIDNARIHVRGPEIPILDGSALPFVELIHSAGICRQDEPARMIRVSSTVSVSNDSRLSTMSVTASGAFELTIETQFHNWPDGSGINRVVFHPWVDVFETELAPARTFAFADEVDHLLKAGLARGGSLENVVIITPPESFSSPLRLPGEWWRHKALDVIGDLALLDARLSCAITAVRPGHSINTRLASALHAQNLCSATI